MIIEEILVANGAAVLILVILLISRYMARRYYRPEDKLFTATIFIGIGASIFEAISFLVDGKPELYAVNMITNTLLYACTATVSLLWVMYVDSHFNRNFKLFKKLYIPFIAIWGCLLITLVFNAFFGFYFKIDANSVYSRELPGYLFYAFLIASFIVTIIIYIKHRISHGEAQFFPIWMFLSPIVLMCVFQMIWYGISTAWLGCAIGIVGIHVNMQSKFSFVDTLTNLYNRAYIEHKLIAARESQRYVISGIMLDVDYFKEINDNYGHSVGDNALIDAAGIMLNATDRNSLPFRFAGDEFIILVKVPVNKADELEARTIEVEERVRQEAEKFNNSGKAPYKLIFSIGHAMYDKNAEDDEFFRKMDEKMYLEKQEHHQRRK